MMERSLRERTVFSSRGLAPLLATCLLFGSPGRAQALEFFAIIANFTGAADVHAQIDVGGDTQAGTGGEPVPILFNVFGPDGAPIGQFQVLTNAQGFASSSSAAPPNDDLFMLSGGFPALVAVSTPTTSSLFSAVLRQTLRKSGVAVALPQARAADGSPFGQGRVFSIPMGDIGKTATLLVANLQGSDIAVDVFTGTKGAPGFGKYHNPRLRLNSLWIVDIDPADAHSHLVLSSTGDVIVQLAVDGGKGPITEVAVLPVN